MIEVAKGIIYHHHQTSSREKNLRQGQNEP